MKWYKPLAIVIVFLLATTILCSCRSQSSGEEVGVITARVLATRNFGQELVLDETLKVPSETSAMAALQEVAEIETEYGGGFVQSINGVCSKYGGSHPAKEDWFIYVNGILANVGALDYVLHEGDIEHWDFHNWGFRQFIPAIIGDFPEPFLHGYGGKVEPTLIVYENGLREDAQAVESKLIKLGVESVAIRTTSQLTGDDKQHSNLILLGTYDCQLVSELNQVWHKLGFFIHLEDGMIIAYDSEGEIVSEYGAGSGVIQATQNPWNPNGIGACENVVWMVSGTDKEGVSKAADALANNYTEFLYAFAVAITEGKIIKVPR